MSICIYTHIYVFMCMILCIQVYIYIWGALQASCKNTAQLEANKYVNIYMLYVYVKIYVFVYIHVYGWRCRRREKISCSWRRRVWRCVSS